MREINFSLYFIHMTKTAWFGVGVFIIAAIAGVILFLIPAPTKAPTTDSGNISEKADLIVVDSLSAGDQIASPLVVTGKARGTWYFEATFPIEVQDASGNVIGQGYAQAQGEWMTNDFVPFQSITLTFAPQPAGSSGTLVLRKDNPSALPENDDSLIIPIVF